MSCSVHFVAGSWLTATRLESRRGLGPEASSRERRTLEGRWDAEAGSHSSPDADAHADAHPHSHSDAGPGARHAS